LATQLTGATTRAMLRSNSVTVSKKTIIFDRKEMRSHERSGECDSAGTGREAIGRALAGADRVVIAKVGLEE
jgi:hypothetical protein